MKRKLNIAVVSAFWPPARLSGTELFNDITARLLKKKHKVVVVTSDSVAVRYIRNIFSNPRIADDEKKDILRLKHHPGKAFLYYICYIFLSNPLLSPLIPKIAVDYITQRFYGPQLDTHELKKILVSHKFDIIYLSSLPYFLNYQITSLVKQTKMKTRIIMRPNFHALAYQKNNSFYKNVLNACNSIHVWTRAEKNQVSHEYLISPTKIKIISPPIYEKGIVPSVPNLKTMFQGKRIILYAGTKNKEKGVYRLIAAIQKLKSSNLALVTIGSYDFNWIVYKLFSKHTFLFDLGYVSEKEKEYLFNICNIFCLPSIADSFCIAAFDAWKNKKPVVLGRTEVSEEIMSKIQGGVIVDIDNNNELSRVISSLLSNTQLSNILGINGYKSMRNYYSKNKNTKKYIQLFHV
jgi:glycosyltransferase involved in cell wall biosynthesis